MKVGEDIQVEMLGKGIEELSQHRQVYIMANIVEVGIQHLINNMRTIDNGDEKSPLTQADREDVILAMKDQQGFYRELARIAGEHVAREDQMMGAVDKTKH